MKKMTAIILTVAMTVSLIIGAAGTATAADNTSFIKALKSDNVGWRVSAANLLGDAKDENAVAPLITMLKTDRNYSARVSAAVALAKIGDPKALRALKRAARNDRDQTVRTVTRAAYNQLKREMEKVIAANE